MQETVPKKRLIDHPVTYDILCAIVYFARDEQDRTHRGKNRVFGFFHDLKENYMEEMPPRLRACFERLIFWDGGHYWGCDGLEHAYTSMVGWGVVVTWISPTNYWDVSADVVAGRLDVFNSEEIKWLEMAGRLYCDQNPVGDGKCVRAEW